jgi:hypothetical protein
MLRPCIIVCGFVVAFSAALSRPSFADQRETKSPNSRANEESGDPTRLQPDEIRAVWDRLAEVTVFPSKDPRAYGGKPPAPGAISGGDFKTRYVNGLERYMALRQGEIAKELGIRAWAIEFEGGPLSLWFECEEEGQKTMPKRGLFHGVFESAESYYTADEEKGRLLFFFLPWASEDNPSERSKRIMKRMNAQFRFADSIPQVFGLQIVGGKSIAHWLRGSPGRTAALWTTWNDVSIKQLSKPERVRVEAETTLLQIEAVERKPPEVAKPRKVKLVLKAKPKPKSAGSPPQSKINEENRKVSEKEAPSEDKRP